MSQTQIPIEVDQLITEDDTPVDNFPSEKQQRLLTEPLYSSWPGPGEGRTFLAAANVGVFSSVHLPSIVPDVFVSLDVEIAADWWAKAHRSYFFWEFGKAPDVVIEIVSNKEGQENSEKLRRYERMAVPYYVIFDPIKQIQPQVLTIYELHV
ncbi:MAG: Uma2 family endonuclease, partial [Acidobacteriota bacterium]